MIQLKKEEHFPKIFTEIATDSEHIIKMQYYEGKKLNLMKVYGSLKIMLKHYFCR